MTLRPCTYDVTAEVHAIQNVGGGWIPLATYGPTFNALAMSSPGQVAVSPVDGSIFIADTGNNRVVKLDSSGSYVSSFAVTGVTGVAVDASGNIYVTTNEGAGSTHVRKYNSAFTLQWQTAGSVHRNICTDGTHIYTTRPNDGGNNYVFKRDVATGTSFSLIGAGGYGSSNGQFGTDGTHGIAYSSTDSLLYVVDPGNSRVQVFTTAGVYVRQFPIPANARGIALDASGDVWVAVYGSDQLQRYSNTGTLQETLAQTDPDGIAVATGDVLFVSNVSAGTIAKWDEAASGYGELAISINGNLSPYIGIGNRNGAVANAHTVALDEPAAITVQAYGKATSGTATFSSIVLSARAVPRR